MKMIIPCTNNNHKALAITGIFALLLFASCAKKISFQNSSVVPAAVGTVKVKKDNNSNYSVNLNIKSLAKPDRLTPPMSIYVVWMETANDGRKNLGQLKTSSGLFSKTLKSSLTTVSPFKPTKIFITAENDATTRYPGSLVVLSTASF